MKLSVLRFAVLVGLLTIAANGFAKDKQNAKQKEEPSAKTVDSGSFGVFQNEKRIATETFSIVQSSHGSVATSDFKTESTAGDASQSSKLELAANGEIVHYEWKESSPGSAEATVAPNNDFLAEHFKDSRDAKEQVKPFLLPASTSILDDYFFIQREILVWKYLATSCKTQKGILQCPLKQEVKFGALNAHSQISIPVSLTFLGPDEVEIHGVQQKLSKIDLKSDSGDWFLWVNEQFKLIRIEDVDTGTEIVRD
ncbi:MAG TPA: hypothetical protein VN684_04735 [Terriglobales bacterium]|nr:hypothetical protein [Terriglobales bacterium]